MLRLRLSAAMLIVCFFLSPASTILDGAAAAQDDPPPIVPSNIQVSPVLAQVFGEVLAVSPTLANQCQRIGGAKYVHVRVTPVMAASTVSRGSARTKMRRFSSGALLAAVEIPVPLTTSEYAEFFGHEFEHILEQIDRVDLEALTARGGGATRLADGAYETRRAHRMGQTIADEYDQPRPAPVTPSLRTRAPSVVSGRQ
jgi:hypothetical protein